MINCIIHGVEMSPENKLKKGAWKLESAVREEIRVKRREREPGFCGQ